MHHSSSQISRVDYFKNQRRQSRLFAFFITFLLFSTFLVSSYYITWLDTQATSFATDLTLAVDLGNSTVGTSAVVLPSAGSGAPPPPPVASNANADDKEMIAPAKTESPFDEDVNLADKKNKPKKKTEVDPLPSPTPAKKQIPKALFSKNTFNANSTSTGELYSNNATAGGEKRGRADGIEGGSSNLSANGISVTGGLRNRAVDNYPTFNERFSENALVRVEVRVDASGVVHFLRFGKSTTTNKYIQSIVLDKLSKLKFSESVSPTDPDQFGVLEFKLRVK